MSISSRPSPVLFTLFAKDLHIQENILSTHSAEKDETYYKYTQCIECSCSWDGLYVKLRFICVYNRLKILQLSLRKQLLQEPVLLQLFLSKQVLQQIALIS